ncbi:MAG TPA: alkaline phosphatase family protein [Actinomycetota bacterium]|nr:alkaline phosphatase family protein [Actinomycetota bacterium]
MTQKAAVIGLDGSGWHLLDPLIEDGVMPRLDALRARGASGILASTVPTYTPPAWTSAITGVNPGRHGVYGFVDGNVQSESKLMHAGRISAPTIWEMANEQGASAGIYNVPLTYPPQALDGWMVSGMLTPGYGERRTGYTWPVELESDVESWEPGYLCDVSGNWEQDWRDDGLCRRVLTSLQQRVTVLDRLLDERPPDLLFAVLEAPDRLQHVYYRYMDPSDELYDTPEGRRLRPAIAKCFAVMDRIVGLVDDFAGSDGGVVVCSDHGFTAWEFSVHTNTLLQQWGLLALKPGAGLMQTEAARRIVPIAKRILPAKVARRAKGQTFAAIDWAKTYAFASPIPQQGIYVNLAGREPNGIVPPAELQAMKENIAARFRALKDAEDRPLTDHVWLSEEVFHGEELEGAPDVLPVLRDHRYELDDELFHKEPLSDFRHLPRGAHHPDGIVAVAGRGVRSAGQLTGSVLDITPTLLYMADLEIPDGLDGRLLRDAFVPETFEERPPRSRAPLSSVHRDESSPYSEDEEAQIEEALRGLGYI